MSLGEPREYLKIKSVLSGDKLQFFKRISYVGYADVEGRSEGLRRRKWRSQKCDRRWADADELFQGVLINDLQIVDNQFAFGSVEIETQMCASTLDQIYVCHHPIGGSAQSEIVQISEGQW